MSRTVACLSRLVEPWVITMGDDLQHKLLNFHVLTVFETLRGGLPEERIARQSPIIRMRPVSETYLGFPLLELLFHGREVISPTCHGPKES